LTTSDPIPVRRIRANARPIDAGLRRGRRLSKAGVAAFPIPPRSGSASAQREGAMTSVRPRSRELAGRASTGTRLRLPRRQGGRGNCGSRLGEPDANRALAVPGAAERAVDVFQHLYAYASLHRVPLPAEALAVCGRRPEAAREEDREQ
jgi:hypothetical protein